MPRPSPSELGQLRAAKTAAAETQIAKDNAKAKERKKKLAPSDLKKTGTAFGNHIAVVADQDFALALIDIDYFGGCAQRLHRMDRISILNKSGTQEADAVVTGVDEHGGKVQLFVRQQWAYPQSDIGATDENDAYKIVDNGFADGFSIKRRADGVVLAKNIANYQQALAERHALHQTKLS
jgi:hypothetical protein